MMYWRELLGIVILFELRWISSAPMLCHLPDTFNKGHCVIIKECTSINLSDSIISPDVFEDFTNRKESCSAFGSNLVCCELTKYTTPYEPVTMKGSISTTVAPVTTVSILTTKTTSVKTTTDKIENTTAALAKLEEINVKSSDQDFTEHKNFKLFDRKICGKTISKRGLPNGENAEVLEFPWIARFKYQGERSTYYGCAGSLISEYYVLTAAHCVIHTPKLIRVRLGEHNATSNVDCNEDMVCADPVQDVEIESIIPHPKFDPVKITHDIALIHLSKPAKLNQNNINTICLPLDEVSSKKVHPNYLVIGWGGTENGTSHPILQKAIVPPVDITECNAKFAKIKQLNLTEDQMCAGGVERVDACKGDSGGPLQGFGRVNKIVRIVQYGVVSFGVKTSGQESYPGIYTNVVKYLSWILDNMS